MVGTDMMNKGMGMVMGTEMCVSIHTPSTLTHVSTFHSYSRAKLKRIKKNR